MHTLAFEERAVAFVDVLGFRGLTKRAGEGDSSAVAQLAELVGTLETAIPTLDSRVECSVRHLAPMHTYISDSIILSAPAFPSDPRHSHIDGLSLVVMRVIQLTHRFAAAGYLLRGGLALGKVWHTPSNVVGPAYIDAYDLERCTSSPRVVLSADAKAQWLRRYTPTSEMCVEYDDCFMVNGLHGYYTPDTAGHGDALRHYDAIAARTIETHDDPRVVKKWQWFRGFVAWEMAEGVGS